MNTKLHSLKFETEFHGFRSTIKYCFAEPYIDKDGVLHKYYTSIYDDKGNEIVIEILFGIVNRIDKNHGILNDEQYESYNNAILNVNDFWKEHYKK